jgi:hypothetical protein
MMSLGRQGPEVIDTAEPVLATGPIRIIRCTREPLGGAAFRSSETSQLVVLRQAMRLAFAPAGHRAEAGCNYDDVYQRFEYEAWISLTFVLVGYIRLLFRPPWRVSCQSIVDFRSLRGALF